MSAIVRSNALVFAVPQDPKEFGGKESTPIFDSLELPGIPLFLRFSPDDESLIMLCSSLTPGKDSQTTLMQMKWGKYAGKKAIGGEAAMARFAPRKIVTLMTGKDLFFTYTTSSTHNSSIVAHSEREFEDDKGVKRTEKGVWLHREDRDGSQSKESKEGKESKEYENWQRVSVSKDDKWSTPVCHSAGGGDSVLVVEDGWLVSKALSRFKRDEHGELHSKRILEVKGEINFLVSPDSSRAVVLQEDIDRGELR